MTNQDGISVIICCFNSSQKLPSTLSYLRRQEFSPELNIEIIIIDNNSSDDTYEVALKLSKEMDEMPVKIFKESTPGLINAKRKGAKEALYNLFLFCDDDNWLEYTYIQEAYTIMKCNPGIGVLGGKIEATCEQHPPVWFENFKYAFAIGEQSNKERDISQRGFVWGAGMVVRKELWDKIQKLNLVSFISGRKGLSLSAGEDSELSLLSLILGYQLWYSPKLSLKHFVPANRLSWAYLVKVTKGFGESNISLAPLKKILLLRNNQIQLNFSWKKEVFKILLLWLSHPRMTLKGLTGKEGEKHVIWFNYYYGYFLQLLRKRNKINSAFRTNYDILKKNNILK